MMMSIFLFFIFCMTLSGLVLMASFVFSSKISSACSQKMSPFECGFDPKDLGRPLFSMHFFLLGLLFLVFDLELVILFPFLMMMKSIHSLLFISGAFVFLVILLLGLFFEWNQSFLEWSV